jgi:hypothetical protein
MLMDHHHLSNITKLKKKNSLDGTKVQQPEWFFFVVDFLPNGNIKNEKKRVHFVVNTRFLKIKSTKISRILLLEKLLSYFDTTFSFGVTFGPTHSRISASLCILGYRSSFTVSRLKIPSFLGIAIGT